MRVSVARSDDNWAIPNPDVDVTLMLRSAEELPLATSVTRPLEALIESCHERPSDDVNTPLTVLPLPAYLAVEPSEKVMLDPESVYEPVYGPDEDAIEYEDVPPD